MQEIKTTPDGLDKLKRARNAFIISLVTATLIALSMTIALVINGFAFLAYVSPAALVVLASLFSAWQSRRGNSDVGVIAIVVAIIAMMFIRVFIQKGLAVPLGVVSVLIISAIASRTLPSSATGSAIAAAFIAAIATILIDQYTVNVPVAQTTRAVFIISAGMAAIYFIVILVQFPSFTLRVKLIAGFLFLSAAPLIILGALAFVASRDVLQEQVKASLRERAYAAGNDIEHYFDGKSKDISVEARLEDIVKYAYLPTSQKSGSDEETHAMEALRNFHQKDAENVLSYSIIDADGMNALDTLENNAKTSYKDETFFTTVKTTRQPYLSNARFVKGTEEPVVYLAAPILKDEQFAGILLATYKAGVLQSIIADAAANQSTGTEYAFLIDDTYFINLAHSSTPELLYKSYLEADSARLIEMQNQESIGAGNQETSFAPQAELTAAIRGMDALGSFQLPSYENNGEMAEIAAARISNTHWVVVTAQPLRAVTALTQTQTRVTVTYSAIISIITAIIAIFASRFFTNPIIELTRVAEKISAGDFTQKANVNIKDEIGVLGSTINGMTAKIQELVGGLEQRVEQRTSELEAVVKISEKHAQDLQTIAEIARYISSEKDLEKLLPLITQIVSEQFGFYHVGIFLLDENRKYAVLRAANSPGGQVMLRRQHKLEIGQVGIVGNVTSTGVSRIALDTGSDAVYFNNPDLPNTRSEMAIPLTIRGNIIGALDVQSTIQNAFTGSDVSILGLLADQIAVAIDNARLLEETQNALAESQAVFREYTSDAWKKRTATAITGYYQTLAGGKAVTAKSVQKTNAPDDEENTLAIPIRLRDQIIGTLNVRSYNEDRKWKSDEINIIQSVAERLALALDNARLFEETSSRASRESLVAEITTRLRGTNDPQEIIRTAQAELQHALGATRVEIIPRKSIDN